MKIRRTPPRDNTKSRRTRPWDAPFCSDTKSGYGEFLQSDALGYESIADVWNRLSRPVEPRTIGPGHQPIFENSGPTQPATELGPPDTWVTGAAGHGRFPPALIQFLAQQSAEVYRRADKSRAGGLLQFDLLGPRARRFGRAFAYRNSFAYGFVFERTAFLIFCGTDEAIADNRDNARGTIAPFTFGRGPLTPAGIGTLRDVHTGFAHHLDRIFSNIVAWLEGLPTEIQNVICAGHSLGGTLAVLAGQILHELDYDVPCVATFGAPAPGGQAFSKSFGLAKNTWRIVHPNDPVPKLTPARAGFVHVGNNVDVGLTIAMMNDGDSDFLIGMMSAFHLATAGVHPLIYAATLAAKELAPPGYRFVRSFAAHKMLDIYLPQTEAWLNELIGDEGEDIRSRHAHYLGAF